MALTHLNTSVFVGSGFTFGMFDERKLFGGQLDPGKQANLGQFALYSYLNGAGWFEVTPERVDIRYLSPDIMPNKLVAATKAVIEMIEAAHGEFQVLHFGMNCDTAFSQELIGENGISFCSKLISSTFVNLVKETDAPLIGGGGAIYTIMDELQYGIKMEPEAESKGKNLFVQINGHQDINAENSLGATLSQVSNFRAYVQRLHRRIAQAKGGQK